MLSKLSRSGLRQAVCVISLHQRGLQVHASQAEGEIDGGADRLPVVTSIQSGQNNYVKHCVKLRSNAKYRAERNRCLLVGRELIRECAGGEALEQALHGCMHASCVCVHGEPPAESHSLVCCRVHR